MALSTTIILPSPILELTFKKGYSFVMARTKEFETADVVSKAVGVFWTKGFEATSIQDLVDAMGINRGSIYDTFGDKAGLFDAAIRQYQNEAPSQRLIDSAKSGEPRKEIELFFTSLRKRCSSPYGCLVTNTITELSARDDKMAAFFKTSTQKMENAFYTLVKRGQKTGEITSSRKARPLSRSLLASAQGLVVLSKVKPGTKTLNDIANTALSLLD